jgi:MFS family permease
MERYHHPEVNFNRLLVLTCVATFGCYFAAAMRLPILPLYARQFGVTTTQIGVINSAFFLMAGLLSIPLGLLVDLLGRKRLAIAGAAIVAVGLLLLSFCRSFSALTGTYLLLGVGFAAFGPTMMAFVAEISPPTHLGRAYGWYTTALFCGLGLGPTAGGALGQWIGLRAVFLVAAVLAGFTIWAMAGFLMFHRPAPQKKETNQRLGQNLRSLIGNRPLVGCWLTTGGASFSAGVLFTFLPLHAKGRGLEVFQIGVVFGVYAVVNALSRIPFGYLSDQATQRKHLAAAGIFLLALATAAMGAATHFIYFLAAALGMGVSMGLAFTSIGALIAESTAPGLRGAAMGGYNACIYAGMLLGSIVLGPVIETIGYGWSFMLTAAVSLVSVMLFLGLMRGFHPVHGAASI